MHFSYKKETNLENELMTHTIKWCRKTCSWSKGVQRQDLLAIFLTHSSQKFWSEMPGIICQLQRSIKILPWKIIYFWCREKYRHKMCPLFLKWIGLKSGKICYTDVVEDMEINFCLLHHYSKSCHMRQVKSRMYYCLVLSRLYYKFVQVKTTLNYIWRSNCLEDCFSNSYSEYSSKPHYGWWVSTIQNLIMPRSEVYLRKSSTTNHFHLETWLDTLFFGVCLVVLFFFVLNLFILSNKYKCQF